MKTLEKFSRGLESVPASVSWYLSDISEMKGKQALFTHQSPQRLKILREHALIESAVSSNRIEGIEIEKKRVGTVIFGKPLLHDRNEEEIQGYRNALQWIHSDYKQIKTDADTIKKLHHLSRGDIWDAGAFKEKNGNIIERLPNGDTRIRFKTVPAKETPHTVDQLIDFYRELMQTAAIHSLITVAAFNLDFLCIHPFRDGNGRISRLLLLLQLYHTGAEVGRYISLEKLIESNKERYYETLEISSQRWHEGKHDPWPYINYLLFIIKSAYIELMNRVEGIEYRKGEKTDFILNQIKELSHPFTLTELSEQCPGVSKEMVRKVLKDQKKKGALISEGRGPGALWKKKGHTLK